MAVHFKDFTNSWRRKIVGHYIEFHIFPNQFLDGLLEIIKENSR